MSTFLKLDIFRKLPKDLSEPTFCGAIGKCNKLTHSYPTVYSVSLMFCCLDLAHDYRAQLLH